jgi:hypothetical protein
VRVTARDDDEPTRDGEAAEGIETVETAEVAETTETVEDQDATGGPRPADANVEPDVEPDWVRRRRLDAVFGDGAHGQALGDR